MAVGLRRDDRRACSGTRRSRSTARTASDLLPGYLLVGFALPFTFIPVSIAALAGVEHHEAGLASGLINTAQQIGGAIGVAVASSVLAQPLRTHLLKQGEPFPAAFTGGSQWAFWVSVGISRRRARRDARR